MVNIATIAFRDRGYWIERLTKLIAESKADAEKENLAWRTRYAEQYYDANWLEKVLMTHPDKLNKNPWGYPMHPVHCLEGLLETVRGFGWDTVTVTQSFFRSISEEGDA